MSAAPKGNARKIVDQKLTFASWLVQSYRDMNLGGGHGLVVTEFASPLGSSDYLPYVDRVAFGVVEAMSIRHTLPGGEGQSAGYSERAAVDLPARRRSHPFQHECVSEVTHSTNWLEALATSGHVLSCRVTKTLCTQLHEEMRARNSCTMCESSHIYGLTCLP